jgi:photosystem II stability/assembly factor-like uncharacterized protein
MRARQRANRIGLDVRVERRVAMVATGLLAAAAQSATVVPVRAASMPASAIGNEGVRWIGVSPAYSTTGLAMAMSVAAGCSSDCNHLWATHDGGSTWQRLPARNWQGRQPSFALAGDGHEVLFARGTSTLQRSDDGGQSWRDAGPGGTPSVSPRFTSDGSVLVAGGGHDWLVTPASTSAVAGSSGGYADLSFMFAPSYPASGNYAPVLLSAMDSQHATPQVLRCTADFRCDRATPLPPQSAPAAAQLVASSAYASDGTVFANLGTGLAKSTDGGATFAPLLVGDPTAEATATGMIALDSAYHEGGTDQVVYASVLQLFHDPQKPPSGGVYRSGDGGRTWSRLGSPGPLDGGATAVAVAPGGRVFAGFVRNSGMASGLLCWTGREWATACASPRAPAGSDAHSSPAACSTGPCGATPGAGAGAAGASTGGQGGQVGGSGSGRDTGVAAASPSTSTPGGSMRIAAPLGAVAVLLVLIAAVRGAISRRRHRLHGS